MKKAIIEYVHYYDLDGTKKTIGGIQTYIMHLAQLLKRQGYMVYILQPAKKEFELIENDINIIGIECKSFCFPKISKTLITAAEKKFNTNQDLMIFASSVLCRKTAFKKVISIQHGVYWDLPWIKNNRKLPNLISVLLRSIQTLKELRCQQYANAVVCVDYNYINWYRTQTIKRDLSLHAIPNFVELKNVSSQMKQNSEKIEIIFARRLEELRGSKLIAEIMPIVLSKYSNIYLTIAGTGTEEEYLKEKFKNFKERVTFTTYSPQDSIEFHSKFDIALVPSIGSEGTSLSLLEAMWAGCSVICTDVGGMTNIVLDGFNGIIVNPNSESLLDGLELLINDSNKRKLLSENAKKTIRLSFSKNIWENKWLKVIDSL